MKVVEGKFGQKTEEKDSASDVLQSLCDSVVIEEEDGAELEVISVVFKEGEYLTVVGNTTSVDAAYTLLNMASTNLMMSLMEGGERGDN